MGERTNHWEGGDASAPGDAGRRGADADAARDAAARPTEIRAEIRETRERLGDTLEEIGDRLNPGHITAQVKDNIRDATIGRVEHMARNAADRVTDARYTLMDTIRENPVPAAMVGIGLGWLFMNARRSSDTERASYPGAPYGAAGSYSGAGRYFDERAYGMSYRGAGTDDESDEGGVLDRARERAGHAAHGAREGAEHVAERASEAAQQVADRAQQAASTVARGTRQQVRRVEDGFYEQPLAVGAVAVALGLAAGLSLPATDREVQLMGDARDRVVDRVRDAAQEAREKVQTVAERVVDEAQSTAKEAAREQGLGTAPTA